MYQSENVMRIGDTVVQINQAVMVLTEPLDELPALYVACPIDAILLGFFFPMITPIIRNLSDSGEKLMHSWEPNSSQPE